MVRGIKTRLFSQFWCNIISNSTLPEQHSRWYRNITSAYLIGHHEVLILTLYVWDDIDRRFRQLPSLRILRVERDFIHSWNYLPQRFSFNYVYSMEADVFVLSVRMRETLVVLSILSIWCYPYTCRMCQILFHSSHPEWHWKSNGLME